MRLRHPLLLVIALALLWLRAGPSARSADAPPAPAAAQQANPGPNPTVATGTHADGHGGESTYQKEILPFLTRHCFACHGNGKAKGDLSFEKFDDDTSVFADRKLWDTVRQMVQSHEMPPDKRPKPDPAEVEAVLKSIHVLFDRFDRTAKPNAGRVTIRRLNKTEYNNTIRDLVGVDFKPADDFPADDVGYGFDNIGDVLSVTPLLLEKYLNAAEKIAELAFKDPEARKRILIKAEGAKSKVEVARAILRNFARRAYRRPVAEEEVTRLLRFVELAIKNGDTPERGMQLAVQATLVSPHFLFRVERTQRARGTVDSFPITEYELVSRLSYFLWSSMPDEELFRLAGASALRKHLEAQVRRMLRDPRARALTENFAGQWLQTRNLRTMTPDPGVYPNFDEPLRTAMARETELFFEAIVKEDRSVL